MLSRLCRAVILGGMAALMASVVQAADTYPDKPIRMIVSFPPGSGTDTNARYAAQKLEEALGSPVVVENRPGGNSFIAAQAVTSAKPDGYTLMLASNSPVTTNVAMFEKLPYDPVNELTPIAKLSFGAMGLAVKADSPYNSVADLIEAAKQSDGELNYGSGSASYQIATELFLSLADIKAEHIPYRGAAPALTDLIGGTVDFVFADFGAIVPFIGGDNPHLKVLAVTGGDRIVSQPDTPTLQESGVKDYYMVNWTAAFAPTGTPQAIIQKLSDALVKIYSSQDAADFLARTGWEAFPGDFQELKQFQLDEIHRWDSAARLAGIPKQ